MIKQHYQSCVSTVDEGRMCSHICKKVLHWTTYISREATVTLRSLKFCFLHTKCNSPAVSLGFSLHWLHIGHRWILLSWIPYLYCPWHTRGKACLIVIIASNRFEKFLLLFSEMLWCVYHLCFQWLSQVRHHRSPGHQLHQCCSQFLYEPLQSTLALQASPDSCKINPLNQSQCVLIWIQSNSSWAFQSSIL